MSNVRLFSEERFGSLFGVLDAVTTERIRRLESARHLITKFKASWRDIRREDEEKNRWQNHHFSPLRSIKIREIDHSKILGDLLNPHGTHGQKILFLNPFLERLSIEPREGNWAITVGVGYVDILLRRTEPCHSIVIIENKVHYAPDQDQQLYRYWFQQIHTVEPHLRYDEPETKKRFRVVYLPLGGYARPAEHSLMRPADIAYADCPHDRLPSSILDCRSFRTDVVEWLRDVSGRNLSPRLSAFLNLYTEIWSM